MKSFSVNAIHQFGNRLMSVSPKSGRCSVWHRNVSFGERHLTKGWWRKWWLYFSRIKMYQRSQLKNLRMGIIVSHPVLWGEPTGRISIVNFWGVKRSWKRWNAERMAATDDKWQTTGAGWNRKVYVYCKKPKEWHSRFPPTVVHREEFAMGHQERHCSKLELSLIDIHGILCRVVEGRQKCCME